MKLSKEDIEKIGDILSDKLDEAIERELDPFIKEVNQHFSAIRAKMITLHGRLDMLSEAIEDNFNRIKKLEEKE